MFDSFLAELLVLGMICILCLRFLFIKNVRVDSVAVLAPLAFLFALLAIYNWGVEVQLVATLALSVLVLFTNGRALFRLSSRLYVDHYSVLFITFSVIELVLAIALIVGAVMFRPVKYRTTDFGVVKTAESLTGSLSSGYQFRDVLFEKSRITGVLYTYEPEPPHAETLTEQRAKANAERKAALAARAEAEALARAAEAEDAESTDLEPAAETAAGDGLTASASFADAALAPSAEDATDALVAADLPSATEAPSPETFAEKFLVDIAAENPVILFMPKLTANVTQYEPYFIMLARKGYRVLTAEFYTGIPPMYHNSGDQRHFRRVYGVLLSLFAKERFAALQQKETELASRTYAALTMLSLIKYGDDTQLFYAVDSLDSDSLNNLSALYPQNVIGFFAINRVSEYHTSGYGFVEQTDPLLGALLGVERDESFFIPRYVANRTVARLESTLEKRTRDSEQDDDENAPKSEGETPNDVD